MKMPSDLSAKLIVFLGPSLPLEIAKKILPNAYYLPPAQCGDILFALRLKPTLLVIIDGFFEHTPAVWHKEILFALSKKIVVAGASSMGALRAAELAEFGMIGSGKIFQDYLQGNLIDDDEVAVLHQPSAFGYTALTDAMVNIRATLSSAYENKIIDAATMQHIIQHAKQLNYQQRTLQKALAHAGLAQSLVDNLNTWLQLGGFINQKKQDAEELLQKIADKKLLSTPIQAPVVNKTIFLRTLHQDVMCTPFPTHHDWLPPREKVAIAAQSLVDYPLLVRLANCLALVNYMSKSHTDLSSSISKPLFTIYANVSDPQWAQQHDCNADEKAAFVERMTNIASLLQQETTNPDKYLIYTRYLFDDSDRLRHKNPLRFNIIQSFSLLWWFIDQQAERQKLFPQTALLQKNSDQFRQRKKLLSKKTMAYWLTKNSWDMKSYSNFILAITRLKLIESQPDVLNINLVMNDVFWLYDALCLTDYYRVAKSNPLKQN